MLTVQASEYIIRGAAMDAMYVTRQYFGMDLYTLDGLISDFIDSLERPEIQEWAQLIVDGEILAYDYSNSNDNEVNFNL